ncbi:uncharacterized protein LOC115634059 [Scaptodrosophila lebanonensis]|uniref:Uncharacterized protein LOC115623735 isoform X2 n=1 Tax=Drosophila lebanonensis TaxID=7225 RepID=A0A6J2TLS9_DROLE|nr:uncharacterized protein LOC115623735 isoform X2 [Scaptodrosophila lebanonensis]XP_030376084.1 uncharacterized protein LOC115625237 isoform X2 [Scaptodrosophila lebanonensis]XP_030376088.1 uncharacterized protein LOC115625238 isoform X2 [Scaptodrosophila lebanonensis]XP_030387415.1 uncharacterized protein LOC115634022 isoform X2 [Scaptodrosophila lebanonensis]XP_030387463.1 uncharacterized protein LOC115634059 [Scaptodrosophila lebanonensis]
MCIHMLCAKFSRIEEESLNSSEADTFQDPVDETLHNALKTALKREVSDWNAVLDKWSKTYELRRKESQTLNACEFLQEWPKYTDSRAVDLIKLDFTIAYPGKESILLSKWDNFKKKIVIYYKENIHNATCKHLLEQVQSAESIDSSDYIITALLPSVLPSNSWHSSKSKTSRTRVTLLDSQESLVLRLDTIGDYERKVNNLICKNYGNSNTLQPFIIVEGVNSNDIKSFFVYFDKTIYKLDSFIDCLDVCFKLFNTLNLHYPIASKFPWLFIQKYFYEIDTPYDVKSANLTALLSFMRK